MPGQIKRRVWLPSSESRAKLRFLLNLELRYRVASAGEPVENGSGRTIDLSSSGLSFTSDTPLSIGQNLDLFIDWPIQLDGGVQLQLVVSGVVVRVAGTVTALRFEHHEFRTRGAGLRGAAHKDSVG
jgi:hypothetical protein